MPPGEPGGAGALCQAPFGWELEWRLSDPELSQKSWALCLRAPRLCCAGAHVQSTGLAAEAAALPPGAALDVGFRSRRCGSSRVAGARIRRAGPGPLQCLSFPFSQRGQTPFREAATPPGTVSAVGAGMLRRGCRAGVPWAGWGGHAGDPAPSPGQGEECPAAEVGHLNCRCGRPWSRTSSGRSGPRAGALAKAVAVWQHFSCPCLPPTPPTSPPPQSYKAKTALGLPAASPREKAEPSGN